MKIVILDGYRANPGDLSWDGLRRYGELTVYDRSTDPAQVLPRMDGCDVVFVNKTPITREIIEASPNLKMIGVLATGYNIIDVAAAREHGMPVCNVPNYSTDAVAQQTLALLLEICSQVGRHNEACHQGGWVRCKDFSFTVSPLIELCGKTAGIIGFGRIGQAVARILRAMGLEILAYARHPKPELEDEHTHFVPLEELLARSDIVSLHAPLNAESNQLINKARLAQIKEGAILLNTARGGLINERDVAEALLSGRLYAYGADVVSVEPIAAENPLLAAPNVYLTPHVAWAPHETRARLLGIVEDNLRAFAEGHPQNVVN